MFRKLQFNDQASVIRGPQAGSCAVALLVADQVRIQNLEVTTVSAAKQNPIDPLAQKRIWIEKIVRLTARKPRRQAARQRPCVVEVCKAEILVGRIR